MTFAYLTPGYAPSFGGLDGSHYQPDAGPFDIAKLKSISADNWIAWKCSQSTSYKDPTFAAIRASSNNAGFQYRLFYHWLSSTTDPAAQARWFLQCMGTVAVGEGVMLDAEESGVTAAKVVAWCEAVEAVTQRPVAVYTGLYVADIWKSTAVRTSKYGPRPMHLAAYVSISNLISRMSALGVLGLEMHAWQYSSNGFGTYATTGVTGRFDCNDIYRPDLYKKVCGIVDAPPVPVLTWPAATLPSKGKSMFTLFKVAVPGSTTTTFGAVFGGLMDEKGLIPEAYWYGPGSDPKYQAVLAAYNARGVGMQTIQLADCQNVILRGKLPYGDTHVWAKSDFLDAPDVA